MAVSAMFSITFRQVSAQRALVVWPKLVNNCKFIGTNNKESVLFVWFEWQSTALLRQYQHSLIASVFLF
jgi:hypothetical protein